MKPATSFLVCSIAVLLLILLAASLGPTASGEHVTCVKNNTTSCGATIDWFDTFRQIPYEPPSGTTFSPPASRYNASNYEPGRDTLYDNVSEFKNNAYKGTLALNTFGAYRSLYGGIWTINSKAVRDSLLANSSYSSSDHWFSSAPPVYEPQNANTSFIPNWGLWEDSNNISINNSKVRLNSGKHSASISSFNTYSWFGNDDRMDEYTWDDDVWDFEGKYRPTQVTVNVTAPKNTTVTVEIYPQDNSTVSYLAPVNKTNSNGVKGDRIGFARVDGNRFSLDSLGDIRRPIKHIDSNGNVKLGLRKYQKPVKQSNGPFSFWSSDNVVTYNILLKLNRSGIDAFGDGHLYNRPQSQIPNGEKEEYRVKPSGFSEEETVRLHRLPQGFRRNQVNWQGYPSTLPSVNRDYKKRGERFDITSRRSASISNKTFLGHTEQLTRNFNKYLKNTNETISFAPRIPRDSVDASINKSERFFNTSVDEDYHYIDRSQANNSGILGSKNYSRVFHHVYSEIPRVEQSYFYQDQYDSISPDSWKTVASDDGVVYGFFDGAIEDKPPKVDLQDGSGQKYNSNFYLYDHENLGDAVGRKYHESRNSSVVSLRCQLTSNNPLSTNGNGCTKFSNKTYSDADLETNAIRMSYSLDKYLFDPIIGALWEASASTGGITFPGGGITVTGDLSEYRNRNRRFIQPRDFVFDYNQSILDYSRQRAQNEGVCQTLNCNINPSDFEGFSASMNETRVIYDIEHEFMELNSATCKNYIPPHSNDVDPTIINLIPLRESDRTDASGNTLPVYNKTAFNYNLNAGATFANPSFIRDNLGIYGSYDKYTNRSGKKEFSRDAINGSKECKKPGDKFIRVENPKDDSNWKTSLDSGTFNWPNYIENRVNHSNGTTVMYNATDDAVFNLSTEVEVSKKTQNRYDVDYFSGQILDSKFDEDEFSVRSAYGQDVDSRHYFNRDRPLDDRNRWTRATTREVSDRRTVEFDREGEDFYRKVRLQRFKTESISNSVFGANDLTSVYPFNGTVTDNIEVYLDVYNFGPSSSSNNEELDVIVNGTVVKQVSLGDINTDERYEEYEKVAHRLNISDVIPKREDSFDLRFNYTNDKSRNALNYDTKQRIDYKIIVDMNHPIEDITSRWAYVTFRDTRYDSIYGFKRYRCHNGTTSVGDCYDYGNHSVPYTDVKGHYGFHYGNGSSVRPDDENRTPPDGVEVRTRSRSMFVHPYLVPTSNSLLSTDPIGTGFETNPIVNSNYDTRNFPSNGLPSNRCANDTQRSSRYCDFMITSQPHHNLEKYVSKGAYSNGTDRTFQRYYSPKYSSNQVDSVTPFASNSRTYREFGEWEVKMEDRSQSSWTISPTATWESKPIENKTERLLDKADVRITQIGNITEYFEGKPGSVDQYHNSVVQHEFNRTAGSSTEEWERLTPSSTYGPDNYTIRQYKLEVVDQYGQPISFVNRLGLDDNIVTQRDQALTRTLDSPVSLPVSEYMKDNLASSEYEQTRRQEGVCISGKTQLETPISSIFGFDKINASVGTRVDTYNHNSSQWPGTSDHCYLTNEDGELFFTMLLPEPPEDYTRWVGRDNIDDNFKSVDTLSNVSFEIQVVGSEDYWWNYSINDNAPVGTERERLIESTNRVYSGLKNTNKLENEARGVPVSLLSYLILLIMFFYILAMASRIRFDSSKGYSTKDLVSVFFEPFTKALDNLFVVLMYLVLLSLAVAMVVAAFSGADINPFVIFNLLAEIAADVINSIINNLF